ncbi:MAG: hypothetical protein DRO40_05450 [Thermoprotei archaeon]|nr:MAG: hypothetical protein DRO40_05450 [Thermoprotei archaeon]
MIDLLQALTYTHTIPKEIINPIYGIQEIIAILIIASIVIYILFTNKLVKYILTVLLILISILHYTLLAIISSLENITLLPLILIETNIHGYSTITIDLGQAALIALIVMWRKKIFKTIEAIKIKFLYREIEEANKNK